MSINRGMYKEEVVHIYNGILDRKQNNAICSDMDRPGDCHTEWSKSDRERQISWNLKKWVQMNLYTKWK